MDDESTSGDTSAEVERIRETERVIAAVCADIAPADRPQALLDLAKGADGEPRLDRPRLEELARELREVA